MALMPNKLFFWGPHLNDYFSVSCFELIAATAARFKKRLENCILYPDVV